MASAERRGSKARPDRLDLKATKARPAPEATQANPARKASVVSPARLVRRAKSDQKALKVLLGRRVIVGL